MRSSPATRSTTALGYYINPLLNVVLGAIFLKERFSRTQLVAVGLAVVGVAILTVDHGGLPWISLVLAFSFGCYGLLRKDDADRAGAGFHAGGPPSTPGAVGLMAYYAISGKGHFGFATGQVDMDTWLLLLAGPVTAAPLILYAYGAKLLRYSTIGLMQYLTPTMIFLLAVFVFREPFSSAELVAFGFIWGGLAVYSSALVGQRRSRR